MADDDIFIVTTTWSPVQANGIDITNGIFSVFNTTSKRVDFIKADSQPAQSVKGSSYIEGVKDSHKYSLEPNQKLFSKAIFETVDIGVITA